jgi:hypothetical protein
MSYFSIFFDESKIIASIKARIDSSNLGGNICLSVNNFFFPSDEWYDFPVIILSWWLENCKKLSLESESIVENYFMDGPYEFWVEKKFSVVEIRFFRRDPGEEDDDDDIYIDVFEPCEVLFEVYKKELCEAGNKMLRILSENHVFDEEVDQIKSLIALLSK